jgi:protein HIRA/HIR1
MAVDDTTDRKIKVWSTVPILDPEAERDEANPKLLCTMSSHTGAKLLVNPESQS